MDHFQVVSAYTPQGDQPAAIEALSGWLSGGAPRQTLLGVTGSGKTYTMAKVIERINRPALVLAPNKTLAAHLYSEFKALFPENAVEYFVSYYDYYQPEAYIPGSDTYIEKETAINETIDKMRHAATRALLERRDTIIVASVSCIYGLGSPEYYRDMLLPLACGGDLARDEILMRLVEMQYRRNNMDFHRGTFRVKGDTVDVFPVYEEAKAVRLEFFGDELEAIRIIDPLTGKTLETCDRISILPGSHHVTPEEKRTEAVRRIRDELNERLEFFKKNFKLLEAQRLSERTFYDLEMIEEMGYCNGIENYSRHMALRVEGAPPATLLDYFPKDFVAFLDESHITTPQLRGMSGGDRSRKQTLVDFGFRLPSALDNRPLRFEEFLSKTSQIVFVSATPSEYELTESGPRVVEQVIRPTGLVDPAIVIRPQSNQVDDLQVEIQARVAKGERALVTTLTTRMAEDLTDYFKEAGIKVRYLHHDIEAIERFEIIRDLRKGVFDVLVGINLLREGLDLPEVSLVAVLDADKEGFLRSSSALIQVMGRAARNLNGTAILYADRITPSMQHAMDETSRRRTKQLTYNKENNITPRTIQTAIRDPLVQKMVEADYLDLPPEMGEKKRRGKVVPALSGEERRCLIQSLRTEMGDRVKKLEFEEAALLRDRIRSLEAEELQLFPATVASPPTGDKK